MSFTNFLETEILDHVFAGAAYQAPSTLYVALYTAAPGETGGGTEVSGGAYARKTVTFSTSGNTTSNSADVEFATATASWGTVTHIGVFDSLSDTTNLMAYAALTSSKAIDSGDVFRIPSGDLDITLN
jgi:hypothetical protein